MDAGLEYSFWDKEVNARKLRAIALCKKLNAVDSGDEVKIAEVLQELFGSVGADPFVAPVFNCDYGLNIHVDDNFLANYSVTILDVAPVNIGDNVMIGLNTMICTVGHPLSPKGRRNHIGICKPVTIGNDVWIGENVTILPGVPARKIKDLENDVE